ncbi:hypothetical protein LG634_17070 [Streptomyces bambusae]|uniref:hypothetical protein n=1 Tax=Streptomyces bambusae TaxID=1550616 RepID=UPI001CFF4FD5|nr:hypothetical protein [Streptomyces bambusae]MCB5166543.1 hypothetical protein [Streptomyces bambusae]
MGSTGNGDGDQLDPEREGRPAAPARDSHDAWSLAINLFGVLFGDDVSDWILSAGHKLLDNVISSL